MKTYFAILALCALPACLSSGGGGSSVSTMTAPPTPTIDAPLNNSFATLLNGVRVGAGESAVTYDERVARAALRHANDMVANDFDADQNPDASPTDVGDYLTSAGYDWQNFAVSHARGDKTSQVVLDEWNADTTGDAIDLRGDLFEDFGIAKAGSGGDQRWVLVLAEPKP